MTAFTHSRLTPYQQGIEDTAEQIMRVCVEPVARQNTPTPGIGSFLTDGEAARYNLLRLGLAIAAKAAGAAKREGIENLCLSLRDGEDAARRFAGTKADADEIAIEESAAVAGDELARIIDGWGIDGDSAGVALPEWQIVAILRRMRDADMPRLGCALRRSGAAALVASALEMHEAAE